MRRYIDADKVLDGLAEERYMNTNDYVTAVRVIGKTPTADVRENIKGEWIDFSMSIKGVPTEACGVCGEWSLGMGKNFCPNCGADMRGEA